MAEDPLKMTDASLTNDDTQCRPSEDATTETEISAGDEGREVVQKKIWAEMEDADALMFHRPIHKQIPNFKGSDACASKLVDLEEVHRASVVYCDSDRALARSRFLLLQMNKTVVVPVYRSEQALLRKIIVPAGASKTAIETSLRLRRQPDSSELLAVDNMLHIDVLVLSSIAVSPTGLRLGRDDSFTDHLYRMLSATGAVSDRTMIVTMVHDLQVTPFLNASLIGPHGVPADVILTPSQVFLCERKPRPPALDWACVPRHPLLAQLPFLRALRLRDYGAGLNVGLEGESRMMADLCEEFEREAAAAAVSRSLSQEGLPLHQETRGEKKKKQKKNINKFVQKMNVENSAKTSAVLALPLITDLTDEGILAKLPSTGALIAAGLKTVLPPGDPPSDEESRRDRPVTGKKSKSYLGHEKRRRPKPASEGRAESAAGRINGTEPANGHTNGVAGDAVNDSANGPVNGAANDPGIGPVNGSAKASANGPLTGPSKTRSNGQIAGRPTGANTDPSASDTIDQDKKKKKKKALVEKQRAKRERMRAELPCVYVAGLQRGTRRSALQRTLADDCALRPAMIAMPRKYAATYAFLYFRSAEECQHASGAILHLDRGMRVEPGRRWRKGAGAAGSQEGAEKEREGGIEDKENCCAGGEDDAKDAEEVGGAENGGEASGGMRSVTAGVGEKLGDGGMEQGRNGMGDGMNWGGVVE